MEQEAKVSTEPAGGEVFLREKKFPRGIKHPRIQIIRIYAPPPKDPKPFIFRDEEGREIEPLLRELEEIERDFFFGKQTLETMERHNLQGRIRRRYTEQKRKKATNS